MIPNFNIPQIDTPAVILDNALARGAKRGRMVKKPKETHMKVMVGELERLKEIRSALVTVLTRLHDSFPSFDHLSEFTRAVFALDLDPGRVKRALAAISGTVGTIETLTREHTTRMRASHTTEAIVAVRSAYIGRISSVAKRLGEPLAILKHGRDVFRDLPTVDDELFTVAIAGFPNVGKSTLLSKLTPAKPEIKPYAFTTKGLNAGSFEYRYNRIQVIDTPGTLDRENPNSIEVKAELTLRYLAKCIVYVFDPTEMTYPIEQQRALYKKTLDLDKPVLVYISKTDIAKEDAIAAIKKEFPDALTQPDAVKKGITAAFREDRI